MIIVAVWVLVFVALGIAAHLFGVDSRDADYSVRLAPRAVASGSASRPGPNQAAKAIR
ncbi:MAG: hypothetical protein JWN61_3217 [Pseudonocardiales bacterium]|nr:hypothetical protein [Jatrophihabitantaceae bacterium]MCW2605082.1 hypothetical protein [Pseudonocardiales bacterium]